MAAPGRIGGLLAMLLLAGGTVVRAQAGPPMPAPPEMRAGGSATVDDAGANAFGFAAGVLDATQRRAFAVGNSFFKENWVTAPASTAGRDGLGPLFNARSCSGCHLLDGRSRPPAPGEPDEGGLLIRIGVPQPAGPDAPDPNYGGQFQASAILGVRPEGRLRIGTTALAGSYADGAGFELAAPSYHLEDLAYGPLAEGAVLGPRVAPQLVGAGLLEAIPAGDIAAAADPDDHDGDGISGRAAWLDAGGDARRLGRFGWKATQPTVREQVTAAFLNDLGITSQALSDDALTPAEAEQIDAPSGGDPEIDDEKLERVAYYCRTLAVPAQRDAGTSDVLRGREVFGASGCAACHTPAQRTGDDAVVDGLRGQDIHPYTDLLLHDMGPALADGKADGAATGSEWRTPPLWGIGLVPVVNGHSRYLHDGRARDLAEAVLWHGGEAEAAREAFRGLPRADRDALLAFLQSL